MNLSSHNKKEMNHIILGNENRKYKECLESFKSIKKNAMCQEAPIHSTADSCTFRGLY